jgi:hypothetical protein
MPRLNRVVAPIRLSRVVDDRHVEVSRWRPLEKGEAVVAGDYAQSAEPAFAINRALCASVLTASMLNVNA